MQVDVKTIYQFPNDTDSKDYDTAGVNACSCGCWIELGSSFAKEQEQESGAGGQAAGSEDKGS